MIDPEKSNVKMLGSKVEINLKKSEPGKWVTLHSPEMSNDSNADAVEPDIGST